MNLLLLLLHTSRITVAAATFMAIVGGLSTVGVLVFIRRWMVDRNGSNDSSVLIWGFVGVCLGALLSKLVSQLLLSGLSRRATARLRMQLSRRILAAPLKRLENLGPNRLQMTL